MDNLSLPAIRTRCPVHRCPWTYDLTNPRTVRDARSSTPLRVVIPPPAGQHLRPAEIAAGVNAARPKMAASPAARSIDDVAAVLMEAARAQDDAVTVTHLGSHSRAELAAAFPTQIDFVLQILDEYRVEPAA